MNRKARAGVGEEHQFRNATEMQVATRDGQIFKASARRVAKGAAREVALPPGMVLFWWSDVARKATN
jgi:hypothetical protein